MLTCKHCKHFKRIDDDKGICNGHHILAQTPSTICPYKSFQRDLGDCLSDDFDHHFDDLLSQIQKYLIEKFDYELFTLHDLSHCKNVEKMIKVIVSKGNVNFSARERFILSCAAFTHDLGMNVSIATRYFQSTAFASENMNESIKLRRKEHHNISCWFLQEENGSLFPGMEEDQAISFIRLISMVIQFHRKHESKEKLSVSG